MLRTKNGLVKNLAVLAALLGLAACQAADGTTQAPDTALVSTIMKGLGAVDPDEKPIDYKPRAPLAMPSKTESLPEPETNVAGVNSPDWPKQQESEELRELKALYAGSADKRLTPEQMRGFKITGVTGTAPLNTEEQRREAEIADGAPLTREEQKAEWERLQKLKAQQAGLANNGLTQRRYLTEPPTEYSTPSPDAPLPEVVTKKVERKGRKKDPFDDDQRLDPRCLKGQAEYCD